MDSSTFVLTALTTVMPIVRGSTTGGSFYSDTFTLAGEGGGDTGTCAMSGETVSNDSQILISGPVTVKEGKIDLFILNETQLTEYTSQSGMKRGNSCANWRPQQSELAVLGITNYSVSYVVPDNGNHTFIFFNAYMYDAVVTVNWVWSST